ncbi:MAG: substrate-binding domain-containing protein [Bryobacterales bacterium]|nr:substrate-binding domain-containing protein [Bryobacteraceae bacterium]MDW8129993.1 substrate-binding domain-containing protein [Bryobacterales bacterium]
MTGWLLAAVLLSVGCQRHARPVIGVVPKSTAHVFWVAVESGARAAARDFGVEVLWNGPPTETEYDRQIQIVDSFIARRVGGLAVAASERKALVAPIERAMASGIPVVVFDSGVDTTKYTAFVATNNYEAGQEGARTLARLLNGRGKVAVLLHAPGSYSTMERERGFDDVLRAEFPDIRIVARQFGMADRARARAAAENMLAAHPDLDGIFASTEPSSSGVALALKGRKLAGKVRFVGFDFSASMVEDLRAGVMDAMVVQDPFGMGYEVIRLLADKMAGKSVPRQVDLRARVVTRADWETAEIRRLLLPQLETMGRR